jgi:hypothetical protein
MRRVVIATPMLDARADAIYTYCLAETCKYGWRHGFDFLPLFITREALLQLARNELIALVHKQPAIEDMVWIDSDMGWNPDQVIRLLNHSVDCVGGTARRKDDVETYVVNCKPENLIVGDNGLIEVEGVGTGFLRLSRHAIETLWATAPKKYRYQGEERRWIFHVEPEAGAVISEDIRICRRLRQAGIKVYLDPTITCSHTGLKTWTGDFMAWATKIVTATAKGESLACH